jgi:hypothetical protein
MTSVVEKVKKYLALFIAIALITGGIFLLMRGLSGEDSWIKDSRGVYVKHGNPSSIPDYVLQQQEVINCSNYLFERAAMSSIVQLNSQCLGKCEDYAVDIVHVPRNEEDDLTENQCEEYRNESVSHFIELNKENGEIVRIV